MLAKRFCQLRFGSWLGGSNGRVGGERSADGWWIDPAHHAVVSFKVLQPTSVDCGRSHTSGVGVPTVGDCGFLWLHQHLGTFADCFCLLGWRIGKWSSLESFGSSKPRRIHALLAKRTPRASQLATLFGFVGGGLLLQFGRTHGWLTTAFAILFGLAFVFRMISVMLLAAHRAPPAKPVLEATKLSTESSADKLNGRQLLIYLVIVQGMVQISGPYFTPYMLKQMDLSYFVYTGLIAVAFIAKVVSLAAWGAIAKSAEPLGY